MDNFELILSRKIDEYLDVKDGVAYVSGFCGDGAKSITVLALRISSFREFVSFFFNINIRGTLKRFVKETEELGFEVKNIVVVFPDLYSQRFCFPLGDDFSHNMLFKEFFFPRKYSLTYLSRSLLRIYIFILRLVGSRTFLCKGVVVEVRKN